MICYQDLSGQNLNRSRRRRGGDNRAVTPRFRPVTIRGSLHGTDIVRGLSHRKLHLVFWVCLRCATDCVVPDVQKRTIRSITDTRKRTQPTPVSTTFPSCGSFHLVVQRKSDVCICTITAASNAVIGGNSHRPWKTLTRRRTTGRYRQSRELAGCSVLIDAHELPRQCLGDSAVHPARPA